jgi:FKBP-type peptidyl-prolyl cis-trans isomerase FklB
MKKWGMMLVILFFAAGLCWAEEPTAKKEAQPAPAMEKATGAASQPAAEQKGTEQKAAEPAATEQKASEQKATEAPAKADMDKVSYAVGLIVGKDMKNQGVELKSEQFSKGFNDAMSGAKPAMTDEEMRKEMTLYTAEMAMKKEEQIKKTLAENKAREDAFLAENMKKEGVQTRPSGLQYKVLKEGKGKKPTGNDTVTVNYRGTLIDGKEFDSSYKRNEPATFPVKGVIPGWTEALELMQPGAKWIIYVPSKLAYQETGIGEIIPPNSTLVFEVELVSIKAGGAKKAASDTTKAKTKTKTAKKSTEKPAKAAE